MRYWYLHGFGSGPGSRKGEALRGALASHGIDLRLLDLRVPSFERQTYTDILRAIDDLDDGQSPLRLLGSSMGGYLAARWAALHPSRVDRMLLLCPGFDLPSRWPLLLGDEPMARWQLDGTLEVEDSTGIRRPLHWRFVTDAREHPAYPEVRCPVRIVHGRRDAIVPIEFSRRYAAAHDRVTLVEVDDDHGLVASLPLIEREAREFFDLDRRDGPGG